MQASENKRVVTLENQLTERFGLLLSQTQLAELLKRSTGGYTVTAPPQPCTEGRPNA